MNQDFAQADRIEGYPSFVRRSADGVFGFNWWAPVRSGDADTDYLAGVAHFHTALGMLKAVREPASVDFYRGLVAPIAPYPASILATIVGSMRVSGPIECGFVNALTQKAIAGRAPELSEFRETWPEEVRDGDEHAHTCLELARIFGTPEIVSSELVAAIDQTFENGSSAAFIGTVCMAAAAGALN